MAPEPAGTLDEARAPQLDGIQDLMSALDDVHRSVSERITSRRKQQIETHNRNTNVQAVQFRPGDLVLVRRATRSPHKLDPQWQGPRRVVDATSDLVFLVENIITAKRERVHARRMVLYRGDLDGVDIDSKLLAVCERNEAHVEIAHNIHAIRADEDQLQVQVEWDGLSHESDYTWEPIAQVFEDLPGVLEDFLHSSGDRTLKRRALAMFYKSP